MFARVTGIGLLALALGCKPSSPTAGRGGDAGTSAAAASASIGRAADAAVDARGLLSTPEDAGTESESPPPTTSEELTGRAKHLLEALSQNNPDLATDILLPREAYLALRDSSDPGKAWELSVNAPFRRAVAKTAKRRWGRERGLERAQFVSFELGRAIIQVPPKKKEWKKPVWRIKHSTLTVSIDGKIHHIDVAEMIGWRGAWYITKLR